MAASFPWKPAMVSSGSMKKVDHGKEAFGSDLACVQSTLSSAVGNYLPSASGTQARETAIAYNVVEISCDQQLDRGFQIPGVKVFVK